MIDINKEAEEYLDRTYSLSYERTTWQKLHIKSFIAGHNSKATQADVIQAQIDVLEDLDFNPRENVVDFILNIKYKVRELQQQLKQLEDETN